jgi:hypothetical protein
MREALFHIEWVEGQWKLHFPEQEASGASVLPKEVSRARGHPTPGASSRCTLTTR